jgi:hypothetical protein
MSLLQCDAAAAHAELLMHTVAALLKHWLVLSQVLHGMLSLTWVAYSTQLLDGATAPSLSRSA